MLRTSIALFSSSLLALASACGDDAATTPNCGAGTVLQNGQCVPVQDTVQPETVQPDTVQPDTTPVDTTPPPDTAPPEEVVEQCPPETAGKGFVGAPCTKDCECDQGANGAPLHCYDGFYMTGFRFCSDYADNRTQQTDLQEGDGVDTLSFSSGCFPDVPTSERTRPIYAKLCNTLADCKAIGAQYTHCGTTGISWAPIGRGTYCPTVSGSPDTLSLNDTCLIDTLPPFNGANLP